MAISQAIIETEHGSRYLQQLCKHWSHKFNVTFDERRGSVRFGEDMEASFDAEGHTLRLMAIHTDANRLPDLERIIADHLRRFAFREELAIEWKPLDE